ncbi:glycosyltransferase [Vibrio antiquarius]|uniref:glycosyltransferase n=1 Tax=Vibrio antiquarius (strain Ex25) TaxID=150340 RepID=UPI00265B0A4C|nr:glycosyltransferase [Vibrio antiquarius]MCR9475122.1 glycosyltransferase [Vibrio antiquarius]
MRSKKLQVVVIVGAYLPSPSAVGLCAEKVVNELKHDYDVTVISVRNSKSYKESEYFNGYNVKRVTTDYYDKLFNYKNSLGFLDSKYYETYLRTSRLAKIFLSKHTVDEDVLESYYRKLVEIKEEKKIDVIIPLCFPFESVLSAIKYKNLVDKDTIVIPYIFDNFSNSASLHRIKLNKKIKQAWNVALEKNMLQESSKVIAMHPLKEHFDCVSNNMPMSQKVIYTEHPLLEQPSASDISLDKMDKALLLAYSGGLFKVVREPSYMLNMLDALSDTINIKCDIYAFGNACDEVSKYCENSPNVQFLGKVDRKELLSVYPNIDVLINLGEVEGKQISSKIFEYMAMGKPIINISFVEGCIVSKILTNYPLAISICTKNSFEYNVDRVKKFLDEKGKERVSFEIVKDIYNDALPSYTANIINDIIINSRGNC